MPAPDLAALAGIPLDEDGPVFREPLQAQAFALALKLHEQGLFTWTEWAEKLNHAIDTARAEGDPDLGNTYYHHWLATLEAVAADKQLVTAAALSQRKHEVQAEHQRPHTHGH